MPKKIIDIFTDPEPQEPVRRPPTDSRPEEQSEKPSPPKENKKLLSQKKFFLKILSLIVIITIMFYGVRLLRLKDIVMSSVRNIENQFRSAASAIQDFDLDRAQDALIEAEGTIDSVYSSVDREGFFKISFRTIPEIFKNLFNLGKTTVGLAANASFLAENAFDFILNQGGDQLITGVKNIKTSLEQISELGADLQEKSLALGFDNVSDAGVIDARIFATNQFLGALIGWLESNEDQNILILFQNISEMRPGGGFVGSYSIATLNKANLISLDVRDIYDPDGQLKTRVKPPEPLQLITTDWGARDANWFFDFPTSAKKIIYFIEESEIYKEQNTKISAAIAINTNVIADILTVTGPVTAPGYNRIITDSNVLDTLQEEVRSGKDRETGEPKRIIKILTPVLIERLGSLDSAQKQELFKVIAHHIKKKNITVYFEDLAIQSYLGSLGSTGAVTKLPEDFSGDYLAVVNANVGGAKTDAVITQTIKLDGVIDLGGDIHNVLTVERIHDGNKRNEWWYRSTNKSYIQILTPPGSKLISLAGGDSVAIKPLIDYEISGYRTDPDLRALEASDMIFGKTVFDAWLLTELGTANRLEVKYQNSQSLDLKKPRIPYTFIFDRQSGIRGGIEFTIKAPAGYHWENNDSRVFSFSDRDPDAKVVLELVLMAD